MLLGAQKITQLLLAEHKREKKNAQLLGQELLQVEEDPKYWTKCANQLALKLPSRNKWETTQSWPCCILTGA